MRVFFTRSQPFEFREMQKKNYNYQFASDRQRKEMQLVKLKTICQQIIFSITYARCWVKTGQTAKSENTSSE